MDYIRLPLLCVYCNVMIIFIKTIYLYNYGSRVFNPNLPESRLPLLMQPLVIHSQSYLIEAYDLPPTMMMSNLPFGPSLPVYHPLFQPL